MKKRIFSGKIVVIVAACLLVALHQARAQEPTAPVAPVAKVAEVVPAGTFAGKVYLTGSAKLIAGKADVKFKESLSKSASDIKVIVTPVDSWSGIYVLNMSPDGFTVLSGAGDANARFNWIAVRE